MARCRVLAHGRGYTASREGWEAFRNFPYGDGRASMILPEFQDERRNRDHKSKTMAAPIGRCIPTATSAHLPTVCVRSPPHPAGSWHSCRVWFHGREPREIFKRSGRENARVAGLLPSARVGCADQRSESVNDDLGGGVYKHAQYPCCIRSMRRASGLKRSDQNGGIAIAVNKVLFHSLGSAQGYSAARCFGWDFAAM